jgi:hypothetical protein
MLDDGFANRYSQACELVICYASTTTMGSYSSHWKDGKKIWSIEHNIDGNGTRIIDGVPDQALMKILSTKLKCQSQENDGVDHVYEVPEAWAEYTTGFHFER